MPSSSSELRRRGQSGLPISQDPKLSSSNNMSSRCSKEDDDYLSRRTGLGAQYLIKEAPIHHQTVLKLHVPFLFRISPVFVKQFLYRAKIFKSYLAPHWIPRYLILLGGYLYRYTDENSLSPKGTPIALEELAGATWIDIGGDIEGLEYALQSVPFGCKGAFSVESSLLGKTQYYAVSTAEDAQLWVNALLEAKQESITRSMGHSKVPVPQSWQYFDKIAKKYVLSKEAISSRVHNSQIRDFELVSMQGATSGGVYS